MNLTTKQLAQVKLDCRKFNKSFKEIGIDTEHDGLLEMIKDGVIEIVGEKEETSELIYALTEKGKKLLGEME
jgi:DNA-binding PadR family transcriptional regulator